MPNWKSMAEFGRELRGLEVELTGPEQRKITRKMGVEAQKIADKAARRDLGSDRAFSGWQRSNPISLDTQLRHIGTGTLITPTRSSAGPWTVAQFGRHQGNAAGFSGPGINRRTGTTSRTKSGAVRRVRAVRGGRWNGTTRGKGTATDAVVEMDRKLPPIADRAVRVAIRKRFDVT